MKENGALVARYDLLADGPTWHVEGNLRRKGKIYLHTSDVEAQRIAARWVFGVLQHHWIVAQTKKFIVWNRHHHPPAALDLIRHQKCASPEFSEYRAKLLSGAPKFQSFVKGLGSEAPCRDESCNALSLTFIQPGS
jgi:hypothetical protein